MVCQMGMPRAFSKLLGRGRSRFLFWGGMRHENAGFVWIQLLICAVVLVMVPFYRLDKEMPAVRAALAHERKETAR